MGGRRSALSATLVATLVATLLAVGVIAFADEQAPAPGADDPVTSGPVQRAAPPLPALGVQFHATWSHYTKDERALVLDQLVAAGATWVRVDLGWAMLQPRPGRFDQEWAVPLVDEVMDQLRERNLKVDVMFWLTPAWATSEQDPARAPYTSPDDPRDYSRALARAVRRWGDVVDAWEVWNEPNLDSFYAGTSPKKYAKLLCPAARAVHRNDKQARVVFGGLMYSDDKWLRRAYRAGVGGCFDVMAVHSYQAPSDESPAAVDDGEVWNLTHLDAVRKTMLAHGDRLPVWVTEFGWSVHANLLDIGVDPSPWLRGVTEAQQAEFAREALILMGADFPYVKVAFWYKDAVDETSSDEHQEGYALLDANLQPRPVLGVLADLYGRP